MLKGGMCNNRACCLQWHHHPISGSLLQHPTTIPVALILLRGSTTTTATPPPPANGGGEEGGGTMENHRSQKFSQDRAANPAPQRHQVSWIKLISEHSKLGQSREALKIYKQMLEQGIIPSTYVFVAALKACSSVTHLEAGKGIHAHVIQTGNESHVFVATALVDMYVKCGSIVDARKVFEKIPHRDVVLWNAMIMGYAELEKGDPALQLYARMQDEGFMPNARTFVAALKACGSLTAHEEAKEVDGELIKIRCLEKGRAIHFQVVKEGFESDIFVGTGLVAMYAKCGSIIDARQVFEKMVDRTVVSWNAMVNAYAQMEKGHSALEIYERMQHEGFIPDDRTFVAALKACSSLATHEETQEVNGELIKIRCLEKGRAIHSHIAKTGFESNAFIPNALVNMYAKCGSMVDARQVFEKMIHRDVVSWNAMILGYAQTEMGDLALQLYARMQHEGFTPDDRTFVAALKACSSLAAHEEAKEVDDELIKVRCLEKGRVIHSQVAKRGFEANIFIANTLVDMYTKCGSMIHAHHVFERMIRPTVVSWTAMIVGYAQMQKGDLALQLYARMQHEGFTPDAHTFVAVLKACGSLASLETGKKIHAEICKAGLEGDAFVATCLVDMYAKCGSMVDAQRSFDACPVRDVVTWNTLIAGYSGQGESGCVFNLFERMQQESIQPDGSTFVSILTVCSHTGLVDKGQKYFQAMCSKYGIIPYSEHYSCMADLLGRAGQLDEAVAMVMKMPFQPVIVTWVTILSACRKWINVEIGKHAFECALRLDGKCTPGYALMTNIYVSAHRLEESAKVQDMRINAQAWKKPGCCWWTDSAGVVHTFLAGDRNHPQSKDIYAKLKHLSVKMESEACVLDLHNVLHNTSDDEKEDVLCGHSDKLAIACALINTTPGTAIRIVKNLQVCNNCHTATALISKIEERTIICRDARRFHVYKDGKCSCEDPL